jgi:hypothetical protein
MSKRLDIRQDLVDWFNIIPQDKILHWVIKKLNATYLHSINKELKDELLHSYCSESDLTATLEAFLPVIHSTLTGIDELDKTEQLNRIQRIYDKISANVGFSGRKQALKRGQLIREKGARVWSELPTDLFGEALQMATDKRYLETRMVNLAVLLPAIQEFRPDLLSEFRDIVEDIELICDGDDYQKPFLLILLAYYLSPDEQKTVINRSLEIAAGLYDRSEQICGLILQDVAGYVPEELLSFVADHLVKCNQKDRLIESQSKALNIFASRIDGDMELLESIWSLLPKLRASSYCDFVKIVAPGLSSEYVSKLLLLTWQRDKQDRLTQAYTTLRDCWMELRWAEAYDVWCEVLHSLSANAQREFLDRFSGLAPVIKRLGGEKAIVNVGDQITDVTSWNWR